MLAKDLRQLYLDFFKARGHAVIKSAPLIPDNDPTVLFTTAGMHPLVPFLLGESHPRGKRLTDAQKCIRTGDIDEVGDPVHLTFFEMMGNWSLGDYFKKEAIEFSFEFLTSPQWLGISLEKLAFTVFAGDADAPFDQEAFDHWRRLGVSERRLAKLPKKDNWWGPAGQTGPCGPDTEMFYWTGPAPTPEDFDPKDKRWVEIWNDVFMQYNKDENGVFQPLSKPNVDTGLGLERVTAVLQGKASCYETELFQPLFAKLDEIVGKKNDGQRSASERIVVEHARAATFIMGDGVAPGNVDQGYVLRRLVRRMIREGRKLGVEGKFTVALAQVVIDNYSYAYPELTANAAFIREELDREEEQFAHTLEKGTKEFEKLIGRVPPHIERKVVSGKNAFFLYETYGFPIELTEEMAKERGFSVDKEGFAQAYEKHQELSRQGAEKKFKGGLADHSTVTTAYHSVTHILHQALRQVLGAHVAQKGSNITEERLRFDFSHPDKMEEAQLAEVERIVNEVLASGCPVEVESMTVDEATARGAIGLFTEKYGEQVKVYSIGSFSKEICGGPHVANVSEIAALGRFKIAKEESSSRGVRRIKAVLVRE